MAFDPQSPTSASMSGRKQANRNTNRYSVTALFSMAAEQDVEVEDELARGAFLFHPSVRLLLNFRQHKSGSGISKARYPLSRRRTLYLSATCATWTRA